MIENITVNCCYNCEYLGDTFFETPYCKLRNELIGYDSFCKFYMAAFDCETL